MRYLTLIIIICSLNSFGQSSWKADKLKGKVEVVKETSYQIDENKPTQEKNFIFTTVNYYDINGNNTKTVKFNDGKEFKKYEYKYDDKGRLIDKRTYNDGLIIYDDKEVYSYNDNDYTAVCYMYNADDVLYAVQKLKYDSKWNVLELVVNDFEGVEIVKAYYKYDSFENVIEYIKDDGEKQLMKEKYTYDSKGNKLTAKFYDNEGNLSLKQTQTYDDKDSFTSFIHEDFSGGNSYSYKRSYKYDSKGNWIKSKTHNDSNYATVYERTIEYY